MSNPVLFFVAGLALAALVSLAAYRLGALNSNGAWAAFLTGGLVFGLGGIGWAVLLLVFFISSSALSRAFSRRKAGVSEKFAKGSRRDWGQVFANGGLGGLLAIAHALYPAASWPWLAFAGAMAAVNADTWATELGVLSASPPRLISTWKRVERGTSGGVSPLGSLAALAGAVLVGLAGIGFTPQGGRWAFLAAVSIGGLAGSLFDSLLGATVQAIYYCPVCEKETERHPFHICGAQTVQVRGLSWLNNDVVNFACSLAGAGIAAFLWSLR